MAAENKSFTVTQYLTALKKRVEETPAVWVRGTITRMTVKPNIVYISIADFVEGSVKPVAALDLTCFASRFAYILSKIQNFDQPFTLKEELKVSLLIKADLYVPTGRLQAQILDIDPVYTVGELAITKMAILKRLAVEGLLEKNRSLYLAEMPMRIGLITGEKTAAFKDFTSKLSESPFAFKVMAVYAKMQGEETEKSVLVALEKLAKEPSLDVVCIVRGGGSKTDLNFFDSEALCRAVANYHIPVFTGIGHEIDKSLLDEVAYLSCITPTDTAKRIIDRVSDGWNKMLIAAQNVAMGAKDSIVRENQVLTNAGTRLQQKVTSRIQGEKTRIAINESNLKRDLAHIFREERERLDRNTEGLHQGTRKILDLAKSKFTLSEVRVKAADPATTLAKGFSLTLDANGKFIRNASQLKPGDKLITRLRDGEIASIVE